MKPWYLVLRRIAYFAPSTRSSRLEWTSHGRGRSPSRRKASGGNALSWSKKFVLDVQYIDSLGLRLARRSGAVNLDRVAESRTVAARLVTRPNPWGRQ
jgi:hypothetical protein